MICLLSRDSAARRCARTAGIRSPPSTLGATAPRVQVEPARTVRVCHPAHAVAYCRVVTRFLVIWSGQLVSQTGTAMTAFALLVWAYQQTGRATSVALIGLCWFLPYIA